jgi:hypothetical protein
MTCGRNGNRQCIDDEGDPIPPNNYYRTFDGFRFNHSYVYSPGEDFADTFANWATGGFSAGRYGLARAAFMTVNIAEWVSSAIGR